MRIADAHREPEFILDHTDRLGEVRVVGDDDSDVAFALEIITKQVGSE
ncbi:MAG: hypothetical protein ACRD0K_02220 [Egibacteraceae bacterium]